MSGKSNMKKISVIIPVYNNEKHIAKCLDSIFSQSLKQIEVICVDDGSTDGSYAILSEYAKRYNNLLLFHQKNAGSGCARNFGMQKATGEYIAFMDGDDFYFDDFVLEKLYDNACVNEVQVCGGSACNFRQGIVTTEGLRKGNYFKEDSLINYSEYPVFYGFWRFIYKRELLTQNNIVFPNYKRCQDSPFFIKAMIASQKFYAIKDCVYCYRKEHKEVHFTREKIVDYAKGMRDCLILSRKHNLASLHTEILNEIHGELSAMMYKEIADGCEDLIFILEEINQNITDDLLCKERLNCKNVYLLPPEQIPMYVSGVEERKQQFVNRLKNSCNVYVYGAGIIGRRVIRFLAEQNVDVKSVLVTSKEQNPEYLENIKVLGIDEVEIKGNEIVLVATFAYLHDDIEKEVLQRGITDIEKINLEEFMLYEKEFLH